MEPKRLRNTVKLLLLVVLFMATAIAFAQPGDSVKQPAPTQKEQIVSNVPRATQPAENPKVTRSPCETCCDKELTTNQKWLVMMPVYLFLLLVIVTIWAAKRAGYNFSQAFYAEDPEEIVEPAATPENPNATRRITVLDVNGLPVYNPSSSRLIAFFSSFTTLVVIVCFISYYAYCMMKCRNLPDFKDLFEVIVGLGLGIVPYGINKLASAGKS